MEHVYDLAKELAPPVVRGYLPLAQANAALLAGILTVGRAGNLGPYKASDLYKGTRHLFGVHLERIRNQRNATEVRIEQRLRRLKHLPANALRAEAHDINGADGFPFAEKEINAIADREALRMGRPHHV